MNKIIHTLYEDSDILAIDKPSGISVHASGKTDEPTIADWVLENYPETEHIGEPMLIHGKEIKRPGIVHRLDKDTSGVMLIAKNQKAFEFLKEQFQNREVEKIYNAIVFGNVKNDTGIIDAEIGRSKNDPRLRTATRGKRGKLREAITEYKVLKRFTSPQPSPYKGEGEKFTFLEIHPKTGRTHQIRVHMKFLNYPIVCDSLYSPKKSCPAGLSRLGLHASSITFKNLTGKELKIESPLPEQFEKFQKASELQK